MSNAAPALDVVALRTSRLVILKRLIAFALQLFRGLPTAGFSTTRRRNFGRLRRWIAVAIFLVRRIGEGALDAPRVFKPVRRRRAVGEVEALDLERDEFGFEARRPESLERYLDMPFGAAVARICKGIGMQPDWDAWACEPWAQEEIRNCPPSSPYEAYSPPPSAEDTPRRPPPVATPSPSRSGPGALQAAPQTGPPPAPTQAPPLNRKARRVLTARARRATLAA